MNIRVDIERLIQKTLQELGLSVNEIHLEHPTELSHGDYSTNVAMVLAKSAGKNPRDLAAEIVSYLAVQQLSSVEKAEVAGSGFINFTLTSGFFAESLHIINTQGDNFGSNELYKNKKVLVEHSSPNLFKPFHIGHVMNNTIGESTKRLFQKSGAHVVTISYPSDVSLGIGKAVWYLLEHKKYQNLIDAPQADQLALLSKAYVEGTKAFEENEKTQLRVREITKKIYEHEEGEELIMYTLGKDISLAYFEKITKELGSHFDGYVFESEAGVKGSKLVKENIGSVFTESDGAVVYKGEQDGLHTRVFINSEGHPTYEAKDIGLLDLKFETYHPDLSVFVTDHEQGPYFQVVISAAGKISAEWQEKTVHLVHGRMTFKGKKMSSRKGGVPLASEIFDSLRREVIVRSSDRGISKTTYNMIAIAALKYAILRSEAGKNINFDPDTSLSFEGDSGPYLQYTYARTQSILKKADDDKILASEGLPEGWETSEIERLLYRFPEVIETALNEYASHHVASYLIEIARSFNSFYGSTQIIDVQDRTSPYKCALTQAVGTVLKNGLWVLGIEAPEKM